MKPHPKNFECRRRAPTSPASSTFRMPRRPTLDAGPALAGIRKKTPGSPLHISRSVPRRRSAGRSCLPAPVLQAVFSARPPSRYRHAELVLPGTRPAPAVRINPEGFPSGSLRSASTSLHRSPRQRHAPRHGTLSAIDPRHRCGAAALCNVASYPAVLLDRPAPARWANRAGSESRVCRAWPGFPWPDPFPPPPPLRGGPLCSAASPVLRIGPTSHDRSSSALVLGLPDAACFRRQPWDLPVPIQNVSVHAWGLRPRGVLLQHRHSLQSMLPSALNNAVGTPIL